MNEAQLTILSLLQDGKFHSGALLAKRMKCSRTTIWNLIQQLVASHIPLHMVRGRGYQLTTPLELLNKALILENCSLKTRDWCSIDIVANTESTMDHWKPHKALHGQVCFAECQTQGRGRQQRPWISPLAHNIYLSLAWTFPFSFSKIAGLSLAVAMMIIRALNLPELKIKWPNDLMAMDKKVGGILIELSGDANGPCHAIIGIGLNVKKIPESLANDIDRPWLDLETLTHSPLSRNEIAAKILNALFEGLTEFTSHGFDPFVEIWRKYDALSRRTITLKLHNGSVSGVAVGIDRHGQIILDNQGTLQHFHSGEVVKVLGV